MSRLRADGFLENGHAGNSGLLDKFDSDRQNPSCDDCPLRAAAIRQLRLKRKQRTMKARMKGEKSMEGALKNGSRTAKAEAGKQTTVEVRREPPAADARTAKPPIPTGQAPEAATQKILAELASLRQMVEKICAPPPSADASLESSVDSMRRLLTELLESRMEPMIVEIAAIRSLAASGSKGKTRSVVDRLDLLLNDLGAVRFEARRLDYFDPLIHQVIAERHDADAPDRVILETVVPGYRTGRGQVVAKAGVTINVRT